MKYLFPFDPFNQQRQFQKPVWVYPAHLAMYATYLRYKGEYVEWGAFGRMSDQFYETNYGPDYKIVRNDFDIDVPFVELPFPDRVFTDAKNPRWQAYGNYKKHPATHMMASNLCWYGKCTFCIDTAKLQAGEKRGVRPVNHVIAEIDDLIAQGYREVFDDSGTFPVGPWLEEFCAKMNERAPFRGKLRKHLITLGCNMKPIKLDYKMMSNAGFRFILVGIESANQKTVDRIQKGQDNREIVPIMKSMSDAGLEPHLTSMFGYDWEDHSDAMRTVKLIHFLLRKGYVKTAQASVYMPPRTAPPANADAQKYVQKVYDVYKDPRFWFRKMIDIKRIEDITYLLKRISLVKHAE